MIDRPKMNQRLGKLKKQAHEYAIDQEWYIDFFEQRFAELIIEDLLTLLQQEWYDLNNLAPVPDESPRDIGLRVGKKGEIIVLMEKIKQHFGVEE